MESRNKILQRIKDSQPAQRSEAPNYNFPPRESINLVEQFKTMVASVSSTLVEINGVEDIKQQVNSLFPNAKNVVTYIPGSIEPQSNDGRTRHDYETVDLAVLRGQWAVAENAAIWITDKNMLDRALPFICEHLILVISRKEIVPTLQEAYVRINAGEHQYGTFMGGPSKTADIEQALVIGAHGPKSLTILLLAD